MASARHRCHNAASLSESGDFSGSPTTRVSQRVALGWLDLQSPPLAAHQTDETKCRSGYHTQGAV